MRFVFDIDGTLCFDGRLIDQTIIDTLLQLQHDGHELIFASARPIRDLLPVLPSVFHQHTLIGANGAMISQQSKISVIKPIHTDTYHHIFKIIQKYELDYIIDDDWNYAAQLDAENAIFERLDPNNSAISPCSINMFKYASRSSSSLISLIISLRLSIHIFLRN